MVKRVITVLMFIFLLLVLCSCRGFKEQEEVSRGQSEEYRLVVVSNCRGLTEREVIMYDRDTKVMYVFYRWGGGGGISPLYEADGSLMVYSGVEP